VSQEPITVTMAAAGMGSLYLCADYFGVLNLKATPVSQELSSEFKPVETPRGVGPKHDAIDAGRLKAALARANAWYEAHPRDLPRQWIPYFFTPSSGRKTAREAATVSPCPRSHRGTPRRDVPAEQPAARWPLERRRQPLPAPVRDLFPHPLAQRNARKGRRPRVRSRSVGVACHQRRRGDAAPGRVVGSAIAGPAEELLSKLEDPRHPNTSAPSRPWKSCRPGPTKARSARRGSGCGSWLAATLLSTGRRDTALSRQRSWTTCRSDSFVRRQLS